ncbi:hypothetical protein [Marichromatium purpuratum]|nr:hypothetical protein [Marichromatium purpuratum]
MPSPLTHLGIVPERFVEHADLLLKGFGSMIDAPERITSIGGSVTI